MSHPMTTIFSQSILTPERKQLLVTVITDGIIYEVRVSLNNLILLTASVLINGTGYAQRNPFTDTLHTITVGIAEDGLLKAIVNKCADGQATNTTLVMIKPHEGFIHIPFPAQGIDPDKLTEYHDHQLTTYVKNILENAYSSKT